MRISNEENEEPTLFRKIPAEIRNRIYEELLGNKTIHIFIYPCPWNERSAYSEEEYSRQKIWPEFGPTGRAVIFTNVICQAKETEEDVYSRSRSCSSGNGCVWSTLSSSEVRHKDCHEIY